MTVMRPDYHGGRPMKFTSVEDLENKIAEYYRSCWDYARDMWGNRLKDKDYKGDDPEGQFILKKVKPYTITGMALFLDTTRETLIDYGKGKYDEKAEDFNEQKALFNQQVERFSDTIKRAKLAIYADTEEMLFTKSATGAIFSLKNNQGWTDKTQTEITNPDGSLSQYTILTADELRKLAEK